VTAFEPKPGYFRRLAHGARAKRLRWDSAIRMRSGIPPRGHFPCPFPEVRWVIDLRWIHDGHPYGLDVFETRGLPSRIQARGNADSSASLSAPAVREPIAVGSPKDSYGFIRRQVSCDVMKDSLDEFEELAQREITAQEGLWTAGERRWRDTAEALALCLREGCDCSRQADETYGHVHLCPSRAALERWRTLRGLEDPRNQASIRAGQFLEEPS
jgi:hypothetical protein